MKNLVLVTTIALIASASCRVGIRKAETIYQAEGYRLVWSDEFNQNHKPDSSNWRFEKGFVRNNEDQWYQEDNAWCENGRLILEARREVKPNPLFRAGETDWRRSRKQINYTSSSINTSGKHSWQYGRFVMRGRIDVREGIWPAWWTLGVSGNWPANGEIDMMEFYRGKLLANIACLGTDKKAQWFSNTFPLNDLGGTAWAEKFHVWRMDWNETDISLYVDDTLLNKVELSQLQNKDKSGKNPFRQPHYMLFDLAIGGMNGGDPSKTTFPSRLEIDYVRVYQRR